MTSGPPCFRTASWQGEIEGCAGIDGAFGPGSSSMPLNNAMDIGQPDARAFEFARPMETLEDAEKFIGVLHGEADAVVADIADDFVGFAPAADLNPGPRAGAGVFDGIGDE